jgi:hypothetical protein
MFPSLPQRREFKAQLTVRPFRSILSRSFADFSSRAGFGKNCNSRGLKNTQEKEEFGGCDQRGANLEKPEFC